ncbi:MAG: L,D-transpeptidase family protein [Sphingomonadaceae bacterium]|nr:L,D-transpeptidase family protein [Sphingomonadaceae bacterium]
MAMLPIACSKPAPPPSLPYKTGDVREPACARGAPGCVTLSLPEHPQAPRPVSMKGVVQMVVSLPQQRLYAFRDGALLATSPVSTGRRGHATPAGHFHILQKQVFHRSNLYSDAPMPYMQRLTEGGVALHAGALPGYPASHGCIRLPASFARKLYGLTSFRSTVVVTHDHIADDQAALRLAVSATPKFVPPTPPVIAPPNPTVPLPPTPSITVAVAPKTIVVPVAG